jgi:hypothetical protein
MNFGSTLKTQAAKKTGGATPSAKATPHLSGGDGFDRSGAVTPVGSAPPSGISTPSKASTKMGKRIDVVTEYQKRVAEKESLNLVVIGKDLQGSVVSFVDLRSKPIFFLGERDYTLI